jgi:uncharacterized membrane protein
MIEMPMLSLLLAALAFAGIHLGISGTRLRDRIVARTGLPAYMVVFSLASVAAIIWLVAAYNAAPYLRLWGQLEWWKPFAIVLMLPAFLLVVLGLTTPNPTAAAQDALVAKPPQGIVRVTRHPFLVGVTLWAGVHLIGNGDLASLLFFAALGITSAAGTLSIDAKRRRTLGDAAWSRFAAQTSILPFAAILAHRTSLHGAEIGLARPAAGLAAYALMLGAHAHVIGVSPFPP